MGWGGGNSVRVWWQPPRSMRLFFIMILSQAFTNVDLAGTGSPHPFAEGVDRTISPESRLDNTQMQPTLAVGKPAGAPASVGSPPAETYAPPFPAEWEEGDDLLHPSVTAAGVGLIHSRGFSSSQSPNTGAYQPEVQCGDGSKTSVPHCPPGQPPWKCPSPGELLEGRVPGSECEGGGLSSSGGERWPEYSGEPLPVPEGIEFDPPVLIFPESQVCTVHVQTVVVHNRNNPRDFLGG
ncbi:unnamed protein product, partial [Discosporangium mesarthrocarpum]